MNTEDRSAANRRIAEKFLGWEYAGTDCFDPDGKKRVTVHQYWQGGMGVNVFGFDLWADSPEGAAWRWSVMEKLIKSGWYLRVDDRFDIEGRFYVEFRQWGLPKVADALYPSLTEAMAMALHAAVVALEGERG